jgi:hypothetical protein
MVELTAAHPISSATAGDMAASPPPMPLVQSSGAVVAVDPMQASQHSVAPGFVIKSVKPMHVESEVSSI